MEPVIQEDATGCAIASAAAIAGITYPQARTIADQIGIQVDDPLLWSDTQYIRILLIELGFTCDATKIAFTDWYRLPDCALLSTKWHMKQGRSFWHWAVFTRESDSCYVLDSKAALKHHKRTDLGRIRPKWYITVRPLSTGV